VLTHFVNYDDGGNYIKGDENIYSLIGAFPLAGAILDYSSFYSKALADRIEQMLSEKQIPVAALDYQSKRFPSCCQDDRAGFRALTEHFIRADLACGAAAAAHRAACQRNRRPLRLCRPAAFHEALQAQDRQNGAGIPESIACMKRSSESVQNSSPIMGSCSFL